MNFLIGFARIYFIESNVEFLDNVVPVNCCSERPEGHAEHTQDGKLSEGTKAKGFNTESTSCGKEAAAIQQVSVASWARPQVLLCRELTVNGRLSPCGLDTPTPGQPV